MEFTHKTVAVCPDEETTRAVSEYLNDPNVCADIWGLEAPWEGHQGDCWIIYYDAEDDGISHVESLLRNRNTAHAVPEEETLRTLSLNDAEVYQALARYAYLKRLVINDPDGLDMLNDATYERIKNLTETPPGPSSVAYNAAMAYLGRKERVGERVEGD